MSGSIKAMLVGAWFYHGVGRSGRSSISWTISGVVVYFLAALLWTLLVAPSIKAEAGHGQSGLLVFVVRYAYISGGCGIRSGV